MPDLEYITINALAILGLWAATFERMLLHRPANAVKRILGEFLAKPFIACPACMASLWAGLPALMLYLEAGADPLRAILAALAHACATSALTQILLSGWNALDRVGREGGAE